MSSTNVKYFISGEIGHDLESILLLEHIRSIYEKGNDRTVVTIDPNNHRLVKVVEGRGFQKLEEE